MQNAYKRKKQPELVRRALLDHGARLAVDHGLAAVTVQAVSDAAGVTKGGFMHHFPSKQALVDAIFEELLDALDADIDLRMSKDLEPYGSFTRAYVGSVFDETFGTGSGGSWAPLSITMLTDSGLRKVWSDWFNLRLKRHRSTDGHISLFLVRLACDGVWLAGLSQIQMPSANKLRKELIEATRPV